MNKMLKRVVVTGMGTLNPVGNSVDETWQSLLAGHSGVTGITLFDPSGLKTRIAGEVKNFNPRDHFDGRESRRLDRAVQLAVVAARQAVADAGDGALPGDLGRLSILAGTTIGGATTIENGMRRLVEAGPGSVSPFFLMASMPSSIVNRLAVEFGAHGISYVISVACASGAYAIGEAAYLIQRGAADVALAIGVEAGIVEPVIAGFDQMQALSSRNDDPPGASRPFDADRNGFVLSEGAAALVLESYEHAMRRGARIYGELAGYGASMDASAGAAPLEGGVEMANAIRMALQQADMEPARIGYINAHGTGTRHNDRTETQAIKLAFGSHARQVAISSTKSMMGHTMGAAGAVEAVVSLLALQSGCLPPTINLTKPDPECDLDYIPNQARQRPVEAVMSTNLGIGGFNAALIFARP